MGVTLRWVGGGLAGVGLALGSDALGLRDGGGVDAGNVALAAAFLVCGVVMVIAGLRR